MQSISLFESGSIIFAMGETEREKTSFETYTSDLMTQKKTTTNQDELFVLPGQQLIIGGIIKVRFSCTFHSFVLNFRKIGYKRNLGTIDKPALIKIEHGYYKDTKSSPIGEEEGVFNAIIPCSIMRSLYDAKTKSMKPLPILIQATMTCGNEETASLQIPCGTVADSARFGFYLPNGALVPNGYPVFAGDEIIVRWERDGTDTAEWSQELKWFDAKTHEPYKLHRSVCLKGVDGAVKHSFSEKIKVVVVVCTVNSLTFSIRLFSFMVDFG